MEIRQNVAHVPTRPMAFVIAFLALVAVAITGWSVLSTNATSPTTPFAASPAYAQCNGLGPDAQERCIVTVQERQSMAEQSHGH